ncbi:MAG: hypothetical protein JSR46_03695 [Verrucomicrobia bacterium]|nr:hypothetical protein [Verrucomicrobiota bacterium]
MANTIVPITGLEQLQPEQTVDNVSFSTTAVWYIGRAVRVVYDTANYIVHLFNETMRDLNNSAEEARDSLTLALNKLLQAINSVGTAAYKVLSRHKEPPAPPPGQVTKPLFDNYNIHELLPGAAERVMSISNEKYEDLKKTTNSTSRTAATIFGAGIINPNTCCYISSVLQALRFFPKYQDNLHDPRLDENLLTQQQRQIFKTLESGVQVSDKVISTFRKTAISYGWALEREIDEADAADFCQFLLDQQGYRPFTFKTAVHIADYDGSGVPLCFFRANDEIDNQMPLSIGSNSLTHPLKALGGNDDRGMSSTGKEISSNHQQKVPYYELSQLVSANKINEDNNSDEVRVQIETALQQKLDEHSPLDEENKALTNTLTAIKTARHIPTVQTVQMKGDSIPHILPIRLKRYYFEEDAKGNPIRDSAGKRIARKIEQGVHPSDFMDFPIADDPAGQKARYRLVSLVQHGGPKTSNGHYLTFVPYQVENKKDESILVEFNDGATNAHFDKSSIQDGIDRNGYLFFYEFNGIVGQ